MNPADISIAVYSRIQADTAASVGLWSGAAPNQSVVKKISAYMGSPTAADVPALVFEVQMDGGSDPTFTSETAKFRVTFTIFATISDTATAQIKAIIDRLIGDALLATGTRTTPTYGFLRHVLALGATTLGFLCDGAPLMYETATIGPAEGLVDFLQGTISFTGSCTKGYVNL